MEIEVNNVKITLTEEQMKLICDNKKLKPFPQKGDTYWTFGTVGALESYTAYESKTRVNIYKTKEEAEKACDIAFAKKRVEEAIRIANDGWAPNWKNQIQYKYYIMYNYHINCVAWAAANNIKTQTDSMYIKSSELVEQIIKEYREDLILIYSK